MASNWANDLPIVAVPWAKRNNSVTFVYPFYQSPEFLTFQLSQWRQYPIALRKYFSAIVVDDGSPTPAVLPTQDDKWAMSLRLFRIEVDIPWNWLAARNIGAHHAPEGSWLLLTDMDHVVPELTLIALACGQFDPAVVYALSRREHTGEVIQPHSASFFMTRELFWRIGGYDEALSGHYGTDGDFRRRARQFAPFKVLTNQLVRYEYCQDSSTSRYPRKLPADAAAVKRIVSARGKDWRPKVLSFPYREVGVREAVCP